MGSGTHEIRRTRFTDFVANHPYLVLLACLIVGFTTTAIIYFTDSFTLTDSTSRDYFVEDSETVERFDAFTLLEFDYDSSNSTLDEQSQLMSIWTTELIYASFDGGQVLTPENIAGIKELENAVMNMIYYEYVCYKGSDNAGLNCSAAGNHLSTITSYFPDDVADWTQDEVDAELESISDSISSLVEDGGDPIEAAYAKSIFYIGLPIASEANGEVYTNQYDRLDDQQNIIEEWADELAVYIIDDLDNEYVDMNVYFNGIRISIRQLFRYADVDVQYAAGSVIVVVLIIWIHTRSFFLASMGMLEILLSFPVAFFIFRICASIEFFQTLHLLTIFLILGIGADDFFVYMDAWRQAPVIHPETRNDIRLRVAYTHRRASKAMFVTTFTTCGAFAITAFADILPIAAFGLYAALLIAANYIFVITLFAAAVVIHHNVFDGVCVSMCDRVRGRGPRKDEHEASDVELHDFDDADTIPVKNDDDDLEEFGPVERFFALKFAPFVNRFKFIIIVIFLAWLGVSTYYALSIPPLSEEESWFPEDHPVSIGGNLGDDEFATSETSNLLQNSFWVGIEGVDRNGTSAWDPSEYGFAVYDDTFDLSAEAAQEYAIQICDALNSSSDVYQVDGVNSITCFMWDFRDWAQDNGYNFPVNESFNEVFETWYTTNSDGIVYAASQFFVADEDGNILAANLAYFALPTEIFTPYEDAIEIFNDWEDFFDEMNENGPEELNKGFQLAHTWAWIISERALVTNAWNGMMYASIMAFIVLVLSTMNMYVAVVATISIMGVLTSVMSVMYFNGAELGTAEAIAMVMLIGFSVDYIVHIGNHYIDSPDTDRYGRIKHSLRDMGISVLSGGITTLGSASFLWFATMLFFTKFAYIMTSTVIASWLWSLVFFAAVMMWIGPENDNGNINKLWKGCKKEKDIKKTTS